MGGFPALPSANNPYLGGHSNALGAAVEFANALRAAKINSWL